MSWNQTAGLANYAKENAYSYKRTRCPFGQHRYDANGVCACRHKSQARRRKDEKERNENP